MVFQSLEFSIDTVLLTFHDAEDSKKHFDWSCHFSVCLSCILIGTTTFLFIRHAFWLVQPPSCSKICVCHFHNFVKVLCPQPMFCFQGFIFQFQVINRNMNQRGDNNKGNIIFYWPVLKLLREIFILFLLSAIFKRFCKF